MFPMLRGDRGFSITELMLTVAVGATIMAVATPIARDVTAAIKLNEAARTVEREFQDARLRAVNVNRELRVRTNCPSAGLLRTVEVIGTAADTASNRCLLSAYPFPADDNLATRPNYDGPVRTLPHGATVTTVNFEFRPDGTVALVVSGVAQPMTTEQIVTVTRQGRSRTVRVNSAGKVQLQ
ncbi:MAG TPA: prepilin-type N-terminal cleavage/methylation domain-containing protein [Vicinamibacterales bacterium]|nr:prepilin-type N-terminal cleavage/methylation domain-containing protein [Vicinamibacterales bacterium]